MTTSKSIVDFPDLQTLEAEAAAYVARLDNGDMSAAELRDLREWAARSPRHRAAIQRMAAIWSESDVLQSLSDYPPIKVEDRPSSFTRRYAGIAAALLFLIIGAGVYAALSQKPRTYHDAFETALGEQREIELPDGSSILLNTTSEVEIRFTKTAREIALKRGEAFFDVASDRSRPFRVAAGGGVVEAVGTAFAVRLSEAAEIQVTVKEGRVALSALNSGAETEIDRPAPRIAGRADLLEIAANQRAVFTQSVQSIESVEAAAMDRALSWRRGVLIFAGDPLREVVNEITRYADVEIIIADPVLMNTPVGGYFQIGEVDAMLRSLEAGFGVRVERETQKRIILTKET